MVTAKICADVCAELLVVAFGLGVLCGVLVAIVSRRWP